MKRTLEDTESQEDNPNIPSAQPPTAATTSFANSRDSSTTNARSFIRYMAPRACFLDLPYEIRLQIYYYCTPRQAIMQLHVHLDHARYWLHCPIHSNNLFRHSRNWSKHKTFSCGLFRVSRKVSEEALDIFYGENILLILLGMSSSTYLQRGKISEQNLRRIKNVFIIASPYDDTESESGLAINWAAIFANLQEPHFLLPKPSSDYMVCPCDTGRWRSSAAPQLKELINYLGKLLASKRPEVIIKFDDTGDSGVSELIRRHFPNHSVKVQLSDEVFERSEALPHWLKRRSYLAFP
ncbi:hypothetical protein HYALB_00009221 [Hymenoscyphus albidus]|uniref:F-box domain-containing protein n=1 Tax=Hymenoscyphus albidus TaxID=595503 RepID=A0A9N9LFB4_9HELO|nr:hypothetical protein HYALB_00009221 [Hymenoscyphus albidus]